MHRTEFIPLTWLERAAWNARSRLVVYSRPVAIERRRAVRRTADRTEKLLRSLLSVQG